MHQPENGKVIENPVFTMWLDELGILCLISKKHKRQEIEETEKLFTEIKQLLKGQKRCMLMDLTNFQMPSKESRDHGAIELPKMVTSIAFLSGSVLGAFVANSFFTVWRQPYPTKMFTDEKKAREWLKKYLKKNER